MESWSWNWNESSDDSGTGGIPNSYTLNDSGTYTLGLNSGLCTMESEPMTIQVEPHCENCPIDDITINSITYDEVANENGLCWYTVELSITSNWGTDFTATLTNSNQQLISVPSTLTITPGTNTYYVTIIPLSGHTGGTSTWQLLGSFSDGEQSFLCTYEFPIDIERCHYAKSQNGADSLPEALSTTPKSDLLLYPNPAQNEVNIQYEAATTQVDLQLFDATGRLVASHATKDPKGTWKVDVSKLTSGLYIVILRENGQIVTLRKLQVL